MRGLNASVDAAGVVFVQWEQSPSHHTTEGAPLVYDVRVLCDKILFPVFSCAMPTERVRFEHSYREYRIVNWHSFLSMYYL